jgi:DNA replication protein DnaC
VIGGPTGVGKSWLACALGHKACREGWSVLYRRASRLFAELATARGEGRLSRFLATLERTRLLIIDDWGPEPLTAEQCVFRGKAASDSDPFRPLIPTQAGHRFR